MLERKRATRVRLREMSYHFAYRKCYDFAVAMNKIIDFSMVIAYNIHEGRRVKNTFSDINGKYAVGKEEKSMATSTFERKIEISDPESLKKLAKIMDDEAPGRPLSEHPFSDAERNRGEALLKQYLSRSGR